MKNKIITVMLALAILIVTVFSASAQTTDITITSTPATSAVLNTQYSYQVTAVSESGITDFEYSLVTVPAGMIISDGGLVTWVPAQLGTFSVQVKVAEADNTSNFATQQYNINVVDGAPRFEAADISLGSSTQNRDEQIINIPWTVKNAGSEAITNIVLQNTVSSSYQFEAVLPKTTLEPGESMNVLVSVFVPESQDAGTKRIGQITLTGTASIALAPLTRNVDLQTENNLVIERIEVRVDGKRDTLTSSGSVGEDAELGSEIEIKVRIKNTLDGSGTEFEMRNIEVELESFDLDNADGLDATTSNLRAGRSDDSMVITFVIDSRDVDPRDAPFDIEVILTGEQRNGAQHGETWTITLDMSVQSRDVRFLDINIIPSALSCNDARIRVESEIRNVGSRDLDQAMIKYYIPDLGITFWNRDIVIDEGDEETISDFINIPSTAKAGTHLVELEIYPTRTSSRTDSFVTSIVIPDCSGTTSNGNNGSSGNDVVTPPSDVVITGTPVTSATGSSAGQFFASNTYLIVLGLLVIILLVVVVILAAKLAR